MTLVKTNQKTKGRVLQTNGLKKTLVHGTHPTFCGYLTFCGVELSNPIEYEGDEADVTCSRCIQKMEEKWTRRCSGTNRERI